MFSSSASLAGAFGGAIAYGVGHMNGVNGLPGWRWLFILEGISACMVGFFVMLILPSYPESAQWLTDKEKELATERLRSCGSSADDKMTWIDAKETLMVRLLQPILSLFKQIGSTETMSRSFRAPSKRIKLT